MTVAVEAKNTRDLPKVVEVLRQIAKEDPTLQVTINEETGEHLMAGMGELHLDVTVTRLQRDRGVELKTSPPIVVYRESIAGRAGPVEGKSPNHHNRFYIEFEPLEPGVIEALKEGKISMKMEEIERRKILIEKGMEKEEARNIVGFLRHQRPAQHDQGHPVPEGDHGAHPRGLRGGPEERPHIQRTCAGHKSQARGCKASRGRSAPRPRPGHSCGQAGSAGRNTHGRSGAAWSPSRMSIYRCLRIKWVEPCRRSRDAGALS